jgi:quercetin dioxygenase-like cupin family protein
MWEFPEFIRKLPELDVPLPSFEGHLLQGETHQVAFARCEADLDVPAHSHAAQWELVVAGEVVLRMAGEERTYRAGDSFYIPAGVEHAATVKAGFRSVIFFDQPDRYRTK